MNSSSTASSASFAACSSRPPSGTPRPLPAAAFARVGGPAALPRPSADAGAPSPRRATSSGSGAACRDARRCAPASPPAAPPRVGRSSHAHPRSSAAPEHVPVEVEDRLAAAGAHVHDDAVVLEPGVLGRLRDESSIAWPRPWNSATSRNVSTCRSGITKRCVGAFGAMSRTATKPRSSQHGRLRGRACRRGSRQAAMIPSSQTSAARTATRSPTVPSKSHGE